jgi:hypothetical protein
MQSFQDQVRFESAVEFLQVPIRRPTKLVGTSPNVFGNEFWIANNNGTIVKFVGGVEGQRLHILGDGLTTIANNVVIKTSIATNKLLSANVVYRFTQYNNIWYEDVDTVSGGGGSGEANTASNLGAGTGVYASKVGVDLQFKSLVAGSNVTITSTGTEITISATGGGGGGSPGGSNTHVQYNDGGVFGGDSGFTYVKATHALTLTGPLTVEGSVANKMGFFHNTDTVNGSGVRVQNDGPLTNYTYKASDPAGSGFHMIYAKRLVQFGPEGSTLAVALLTQNATYLSIEGDATYVNAGVVLTSGDHKLTSMLYMTGGDRGMRLSWNYREPYQSGGTQMHSDPGFPVIQTQWETDGAFGLEYTRPFSTSAGTYDSLPGKSWKLYGAGNPANTGPNNGQKEKYVLMTVGEPGRGFDFGIETAGTGSGYGTRIRIDDSASSNPIYLYVAGALRQVLSFNDGSGHNVLYY